MTRSRLKQAVQQGQVSQPPTILFDWLAGDQNSPFNFVCVFSEAELGSIGSQCTQGEASRPLCGLNSVPSSVQ